MTGLCGGNICLCGWLRVAGSFTMNSLASNTWGSMVRRHGPTGCIDLVSGLFSGAATFLDLDGFVQYRSNIPSLSHLLRDRFSDSAKTPLREK